MRREVVSQRRIWLTPTATITFTISGCPDNTPIEFNIYIDPSGTVVTERDGLPIEGDFATMWQQAVARFDASGQATKRNCADLTEAVRSHGRNTDSANAAAAQAFQDLGRNAGDSPPGLV